MTGRLFCLAWCVLCLVNATGQAAAPNILWLTCEDMSSHLGCFGDEQAITPHLDRFAKQSVRYTHAFSVAGVCAPSRSCLITGMYPTTLGSQYMRCSVKLPEGVTGFPAYLRKAGYYCTNNVKTDYNFPVPAGVWDENSRTAHWRGRGKGQPFFAVFNNTVTHESQIRAGEKVFRRNTAALTARERHDPARVRIPAYHPDTPEVRLDYARYFDLITAMDRWVGDLLGQLEADGLADDTIVFFYSDHGVGLPRGKRWLYDTGMRVPLIIRFGKRIAHLAPSAAGTTTGRLVSFVDFGPTALSLAGVEVPAIVQGIPFLGAHAGKPREAVYGIRDRMDERNDCTRAVRDGRYKYLRNYQSWKPWAQPLDYMDQMPTTRVWRQLHVAGKLAGPASLWMRESKPFEELYDTEKDPDEVVNLADRPEQRANLERLRGLHLAWQSETRDLGLLPESEVHARSQGRTRFALGQDAKAFPGARLRTAAELVNGKPTIAALAKLLQDPDSGVRWWGATGLGVHGRGSKEAESALLTARADGSASVRVAVESALHRLGATDSATMLIKELRDENPWVRHAAALALDAMGTPAPATREALTAALKDSNEYVVRVARHALGEE